MASHLKWYCDGPDYHTGNQALDDDRPRGPGALLVWQHSGMVRIYAWTTKLEWEPRRLYELREAKRLAEEWLRKTT